MEIRVSAIIPVYNAEASLERVVTEVIATLQPETPFEIILVNDGSRDRSREVAQHLVERFPGVVIFVDLSRNFGEHNAVIAGLAHARGEAIVVLDDDGQNPPQEIPKLINELRKGYDVVYGHYSQRGYGWFRNLGSWFNGRVATVLIGKPRQVILSSFKAMTRFAAEQVVARATSRPYIDSLIFQCTDRISQVEVQHQQRREGQSNYNLRRLIRVWLNMMTTSSIAPLRLATCLGVFVSILGFVYAGYIILYYLTHPIETPGWATLIVVITIFAGLQLLSLGLLGEYVGRLFQTQHRASFIVRNLQGRDK